MKIDFLQYDIISFGDNQKKVSDTLANLLEKKEDFSVEFIKLKKVKSYDQIKAIHKLCSLYAKRLTETQGVPFTLEMAKTSIKYRLKYLRLANEREAFIEAMKIKHEKISQNEKMTMKQFDNLVKDLQKYFEVPKSFADATKDEMMDLIKRFEGLMEDIGWSEIKLQTKDYDDMIKAYDS